MKLIDQILRRPLYVAFGQALQGGGITSVDLVATPSAANVIITASDGSAAPIAGASAIVAGVMTATDKSRFDSLSNATTQDFPTIPDIAAASIQASVTHIRTAGHGSAGDGGGGLYKRVIAVPPHPLFVQSSDGAFWELVPEGGAVNIRQAGAVGDGITDDHQAFVDAILAFPSNITTLQQGAARIVVPGGIFFIGATLNIHASVIIEGQGVGSANGGASVLTWPSDTTGIVIQRSNTIGETTEFPDNTNTKGGDGTIIRNLKLQGGGSFGSAADGIRMRARGTIDQCLVTGFPRDGIHIEAGAGTGGSTEGNANSWQVHNCRLITNKRNGLYVDGADVNAGTAIAVDASSNGRWGILDSSFLGNTYIGCHCATNGVATIAGNTGSSFVHYNGPENGSTNHRYAAMVSATETELAATVPGTNGNIWIEVDNLGVHSTIPTWLPGQPVGTYFNGGPLQTDGANARNVFLGCYTEGGQSPAQIVEPTQILNGLQGAGVKGTGLFIEGNNVKLGNLKFAARSDDTLGGIELDLRRFSNSLIYANVAGDHPSGTQFVGWDDFDNAWAFGKHANLGSRIPLKFTTNLTTKTFGRSATQGGGYPYFPRGLFIGNASNGRFLNSGTAAPTTGTFARGDLVLNTSPSATGILGWICVTTGTPGTWVDLAVVSKSTWDSNRS